MDKDHRRAGDIEAIFEELITYQRRRVIEAARASRATSGEPWR